MGRLMVIVGVVALAATLGRAQVSTDAEQPSIQSPKQGGDVERPAQADPAEPAGELEHLEPAEVEPIKSDLFPMPAELAPAVSFWTDVFWKHDSTKAVLHHRDDLSLVWQIIDLPVDSDGKVDRGRANTAMEDASEALAKRLKALAKGKPASDELDERLLTAVDDDVARLKGADRRIRAQRGIAERFRAGIERSRELRPKLRQMLRDADVPEELLALPFIESGFQQYARSSAGARGLWQLMPATARELGLRVNRKTDERVNILKATRAAAKMLNSNHAMLGNWPLAITGYNHGPYGVRRAAKAMKTDDLMVLIRNYRSSTWGFASKNFYAEFLAALQLLRAAEAAENGENATDAEGTGSDSGSSVAASVR